VAAHGLKSAHPRAGTRVLALPRLVSPHVAVNYPAMTEGGGTSVRDTVGPD
jgi:hypothetical protein